MGIPRPRSCERASETPSLERHEALFPYCMNQGVVMRECQCSSVIHDKLDLSTRRLRPQSLARRREKCGEEPLSSSAYVTNPSN